MLQWNARLAKWVLSPVLVAVLSVSAQGKIGLGGVPRGARGAVKDAPVASPHLLKLENVALAGFGPDGQVLMTVSDADHQVHFWKVQNGEEVNRFGVAVTHAEFSGSGNRVLTWGDDRIVRIFDARTGKALRRLGDVGEKLGAVGISRDGARILTCATGERAIKLWDGTSGQLLGVLEGAESAVTALEFSPDGARAISLSGEAAVMRAPAASRPTTRPGETALRLWDVETRKVVHRFVLPSAGMAASFSMNGKLVLVQMNNTVKIYDLASFAEVAAPRSAEENFATGQVTGDRKMGLWKAIGSAAVTNAATGENVRPLEGPIDGLPLCNAFSGDGGRVILGTGKVALFSRDPNAPGSVYVYDVANGKRVAGFNGHAREVTQVGFSSDASRAFSRDSGKTLFMWAVPK